MKTDRLRWMVIGLFTGNRRSSEKKTPILRNLKAGNICMFPEHGIIWCENSILKIRNPDRVLQRYV